MMMMMRLLTTQTTVLWLAAAATAVSASPASEAVLNHLGVGTLEEEHHYTRRAPRHKNNNSPQQHSKKNVTLAFERLEEYKEARKVERPRRKDRMKERRIRAQQFLKKLPQPLEVERVEDPTSVLEQLRENGKRSLSWFSNGAGDSDAYSSGVLADPSQDYDMWAQAYRMLGGFIDCDHDKSEDDHNSGDNNNQEDKDGACSRWMMWAAYVNPNYQGNGYYEYFGDDPTGVLDCHSPDSDWQLLGVYRQEFYQYIEQISKHLWAIDEYEYVVALAGLAYMTDYDCFQVGQDNNGNSIYAGVAPKPYGKFEMALYTDTYCLEPDDSLGMTFDDYGLQSEIDLGSKDQTDDDTYNWAYDDWYNTQEYTLTNLNDVYEEFKYCTSCVDYPTYQDGYFIGDYGTDDDDLINQCWKFYSHDSFTCEAECIAMAHAQGTILSLKYGDATFGKTASSFYKQNKEASGEMESPMARLLANAFLTLSFLLFVATFLAFAVARRSRYRENRSSKSRRLLGDEDRSRRSRRSSRARGSSSKDKEGDGLFRSSPRGSSSKSKSRSKSSRASSRSKKRRGKSYEPPSDSRSKDYF